MDEFETEEKDKDQVRKLTISIDSRLVARLQKIADSPELGFGGNLKGIIVSILYDGALFREERLGRLRGEAEDRRW